MSETAQLEVIKNLPAYIGALFAGIAMIYGIYNNKQLARTKDDVNEVRQVAFVTQDTIAKVEQTSNATHFLVNSTASAQLLALLNQAKRISDLLAKHGDSTSQINALKDIDIAQHNYDEHMRQQEIVNANAVPTPPLQEMNPGTTQPPKPDDQGTLLLGIIETKK